MASYHLHGFLHQLTGYKLILSSTPVRHITYLIQQWQDRKSWNKYIKDQRQTFHAYYSWSCLSWLIHWCWVLLHIKRIQNVLSFHLHAIIISVSAWCFSQATQKSKFHAPLLWAIQLNQIESMIILFAHQNVCEKGNPELIA